MCVCVCICVYIYTYVCVYIHTHTFICIYAHTYICMYASVCVCVCLRLCHSLSLSLSLSPPLCLCVSLCLFLLFQVAMGQVMGIIIGAFSQVGQIIICRKYHRLASMSAKLQPRSRRCEGSARPTGELATRSGACRGCRCRTGPECCSTPYECCSIAQTCKACQAALDNKMGQLPGRIRSMM